MADNLTDNQKSNAKWTGRLQGIVGGLGLAGLTWLSSSGALNGMAADVAHANGETGKDSTITALKREATERESAYNVELTGIRAEMDTLKTKIPVMTSDSTLTFDGHAYKIQKEREAAAAGQSTGPAR